MNLRLGSPRDGAGSAARLNSATLADLSGLNRTGLGLLASAKRYIADKNVFRGAARTRVPVGTDKLAGAAGKRDAGSLWVEGDRHVASNQLEYR